MSLSSKGFTLIELLVSIAIVTVILSVIFFNQASYTETANLTNLADTLSLSLRQAQTYGIAVKELTPGSSNFSSGYGLTVSLNSAPDGSNSSYIFFADQNGNNIYDDDWTCAANSECVEQTAMTRGDYLDSICTLMKNGNGSCAAPRRVDISFRRPDPQANITFFTSGGNQYSPNGIIGAKLVLKSPSGLERDVSIYTSGQISVQ